MNRTLIVGYGFLGSKVCQLATERGDEVFATTRNNGKFQSIEAAGATPIKFDWTDRRTLRNLPAVDRVLVSVSFDRNSGTDNSSRRDAVMVGGLSNLLDALPPEIPLCYISTTGVYHQQGGVWVDETSPTRPSRDGGRAHLRAEALLRRRRFEAPATILRFSGIYGPGRVPRIADVIAHRPIASPSQGYLNLIHVHDGARAVLAAWELAAAHCDSAHQDVAQPSSKAKDLTSKRLRKLYVVSDDQPVIRADFYRAIATLCGAPEPVFQKPTGQSGSGFRSDTNKRVWNRRVKLDLLPKLRYPTHTEGLADVLDAYHQQSC